ncbi:MAG: site-2 protease family protein, partial [Planctomycetes bacterium]|nr:site-2 protease family protein [Planctomycetota bacterium]
SWLILFAVVFWNLAKSYYPKYFSDLPSETVYLLSLIATVLYLGSLLLHEFGHALAAKAFGVPVLSVELFALGGVARMGGFTRRPRDEFVMAAAGPVVSLVLAVVFAVVAAICEFILVSPPVVVDLFWRVAQFNTAVMIFNLLPAYPLDGGRLLQGVLWWMTGRRTLSAGIAAAAGFVLAAAMIALGTYFYVTEGRLDVGTIWPIALGVFIGSAALGAYRSTRNVERMGRMTAGQAIDPNVQAVVVETTQPQSGPVRIQTALPVVMLLDEQGRAAGALVAPGKARNLSQYDGDWPTVVLEAERRVPETMPLLETIDRMSRMGTFWIVVENAEGGYVGTVTTPGLRQMLR